MESNDYRTEGETFSTRNAALVVKHTNRLDECNTKCVVKVIITIPHILYIHVQQNTDRKSG